MLFRALNPSDSTLFPRLAIARVESALSDTPAVLIHGPRQSGKSTLARQLASRHGFEYLTFDDDTLTAAAREDPVRFCARLPERIALDEIQRVPGLFTSLKLAIDRDRRPGRFLLTGSANILVAPEMADSLAGRLEVIALGPLTQAELARAEGMESLLDSLYRGRFPMRRGVIEGNGLAGRLVAGGFPAAVARVQAARRREWLIQYSEALVRRDVRELARIRSLETTPRLLAAAAAQTARLFNVTELAGPFELSRPTIREHLLLLEQLFLVELLPPWYDNRLSRLVKTPKVHLVDTGLGAALLGHTVESLDENRPMLGQLLETFVFQELRRHQAWSEHLHRFHHYRDKDQVEVDIVIERNGREIAGVEVKAASTVTSADFRGLRRLADVCGDRFRVGIVLHDGETAVPFGDRMHAIPFRWLWGGVGPVGSAAE